MGSGRVFPLRKKIGWVSLGIGHVPDFPGEEFDDTIGHGRHERGGFSGIIGPWGGVEKVVHATEDNEGGLPLLERAEVSQIDRSLVIVTSGDALGQLAGTLGRFLYKDLVRGGSIEHGVGGFPLSHAEWVDFEIHGGSAGADLQLDPSGLAPLGDRFG